MPNNGLKKHASFVHGPALIALLLSLLIHLLILGYTKFDISLIAPETEPEPDSVAVRFAELVKAAPPPALIEPEPQETPKAPTPEKAPEPQAAEPLSTETQAVEAADNLPQPPDEAALAYLDESSPTHRAEDELIESAPEPLQTPVETSTEQLSYYRSIISEFDILRGINGNKIGQTKVLFEIRDDGSYFLESESEAKGFASIFITGKLIQRSEGFVTEDGLRPSSFLYQYGGERKAQRAQFEWERRRIKLETSKGQQSFPLPKHTQDLMSFMYQFMYVPPLEEMQLSITNGKRLKAYHYSFIGEEELSTKMGIVRAMHLENINDDGDEKNELWLAMDYRYLPVKIRKTEKDGSVIEQVITAIHTDMMQ